MSTIKVDTIATRTGSGNITASNTIAGTSATLSGTFSVTGITGLDGNVNIGNNQDINMDNSASGQIHIDGVGYNGAIALNASGMNIYTNSASRPLIFGVNETEVCRITTGGLAIGGTGAANTLDDYEEGTWTATLGGSGGDPTVSSYSYNSGHYTKIGRQVYAHIYMRIEAGGISGGSGDGIIKGLPFAAKSDGQISNGVGGWIENYWSTSTSFSSGRNYPMLYLAAGSNYIGIWQKGTNNPTQMTAWALSQIDDAAFLVGGVLVYMTA